MATLDFSPIQAFVASRRKDLRRIARATQGEHELQDVETEAIMLWAELAQQGEEPDLRSTEGEKKLLSYLYQRLVPWADTKVRYAVRLDHDEHGDDPESDVHPLLRKLAADGGADPLSRLIEREEATAAAAEEIGPHSSLAAAYAALLHRLDNRIAALADYLLISRSWCYSRVRAAQRFAESQTPISKTAIRAADNASLRAWRPFKLQRSPEQLELDFGDWGLFAQVNGPVAAASQATYDQGLRGVVEGYFA